jgi:hypothetical protein
MRLLRFLLVSYSSEEEIPWYCIYVDQDSSIHLQRATITQSSSDWD